MSNKIGFIKHHHDYLNDYIKFADAKALGVITINGLVMKMVYDHLTNNFNETKYFLLLIGFILLALGIVFSALVVLPRTSNKEKRGLIFWDNVSSFERDDYIKEIKNISDEELFEKVVEQNYFLALTAAKKYSVLRLAFLFSFFGYSLLAISGLFWLFL